ncbi:transposase [Bradyrhizobium sp. 138]|uniref:transposase n=1 Tax=Bradyrhizobium sp. 138 TaxID=2782615 RepID=UPI001FFAA1A3|nr:transposase [Bradyrhizobium sp. 138]
MGLTFRDRSAKGCLRSLEGECWIGRESSVCEFRDARLGDTFRKLLSQIGIAMGQSIPSARIGPRQLTASSLTTGSANRTFWPAISDRHVIVPPPLKVSFLCCTINRVQLSTREVRNDRLTKIINSGRDKAGRLRSHTVCGILIHSNLPVTIEEVPLGLAAVKF